VDGLGELFAVDDTVAAAATRDLRRLAEDGPTVGLHLVLADRCGPDRADESLCLDRVPAEITTVVRFAGDDDGGWQPGDATLGPRSGAGVAMRTMWIDPHEVAADVRDLRRLADERDATGGPQVISGDEGAELTSAPLARLVGDESERASRRSVRLWLGEPSALGAPVEVQLRRQDGANLLVVSSAEVAPGVLFAGLVTARIAHGPMLETWALDLGALDEGFAEAVASVATEPPIRAARKRSAVRLLSSVRTQITERHEAADFDGPPGLLVVHGLGRGPAGDGAAGQFEILAEILRRGPEVGIHTILSCDSLAQFDVRLGLAALAEFGVCVVTAMDEHDSATLLDSTYAASLRPGHALLADEERGRLIKFRPYVLPPRGWSPPVT
jgi:DNA segregation ATPase FtsK/SpoIIIE, S-DNA-T family